jgi:chromosome partitioning protein
MSIAAAANFLKVSPQAVHKQLKAKKLTCLQMGSKSYIDFPIAQKLFDIKFKKKNVVGQIVKGGVGKTTTIDYIANCSNTYGARVLKVDIDPQGNLSDLNGIDADDCPILIDVIKGKSSIEDAIINICPGIDIMPSRIENVILDNELVSKRINLSDFFNDLFDPIKNNYDFIFIDCPPTMGQAVTAASLFSTLILAPLNPEKFSAKGLQILKDEILSLSKNFKKNLKYKVFLNKFSNKTILSDKAIVSLLNDPALDGHVLQTMIPFAQEIPNLSDEGISAFSHLKKSSIRDEFDQLTREVLEIFVNENIEVKTKTADAVAV